MLIDFASNDPKSIKESIAVGAMTSNAVLSVTIKSTVIASQVASNIRACFLLNK